MDRRTAAVIDLRDHNILVSAAAGSGKTAVLVERIIARLTRDANPVDVDHMLIVTYTEAAAAEMKERIGAAIEKALEEDPSSEHLKRQSALTHTSKDYNDPQLLPVCDPGVFSHDRSGSWIPYCGRRRIKAFEAGRDERASGSKI